MKRLYLLAICCLLCQTGFSQGFSTTWGTGVPNITGWTYANGTSSINGTSFELTQNIGNQSGYIYYSTPENLTTCAQFTVDFQFQIIGTPGYNEIADGIAFWYITNPPSGFTSGGAIGLPTNANGYVMIMDTYDNNGPSDDNPLVTMFGWSGNVAQYQEPESVGLLGTNLTNQNFIDDGNWHECKIVYSGGTITVSFPGSTTATITAAYTLNQTGYFGFSASTGAVSSQQSIKDVTITGNAAPPPPTAVSPVTYCQYATADSLTVTQGTSLIWYATPGGMPLPGAPTPNTSVPGTTDYYVTQGGTGSCASLPDTIQVIVNPQPTAPVITGDTAYCAGATFVPFTVTGSAILWYTAPTGGTGSSTAPIVNTNTPGTHTYYATQTVNGCESPRDSITVTVYPVTPPPTVTGPNNYCYGATPVPFTVTGQNVLWYDATGASSPVAPVINTFSPGTYNYYVTQTINGCESIADTVQVTVNPITPPPTLSGTTSYCTGAVFVPLTAQGLNILWYAALTGGVGSPVPPTVNTNIPGVYTFYASQTINGCEGSRASITVSVYPGVATGFAATLKYGCTQDTVVFTNTSTGATLYAWYFGDGYTDTSANPTHIYKSQGTYIVTLFSTNGPCSGAIFADTITISHPLQASFTLTPDTICQGQTITFTNTSIGTQPVYFWNFGDGFGSITTSPTHLFNIAGVYQVRLAENDFIPCFDTAYATVFVDSTSAINFSISDSVLCEGKPITFTGDYSNIGNIGNAWSFGDGSTVFNSNPIQHAYNTPGVMQVTLAINYRICRDTSITKTVTINPYPVLNLGPDTSICPNSTPIALHDLTNAANPLAKWLWSTGDTSSTILIDKPDVYYTTVTINGCSTSDSVWVKNDCYINLPNAFTPNGDGVNDYFFPRELLTSGATSFSMNIYNRWGQQIFTTTSTEGRGWDGRFNDELQPQGVYVYIIDVTFKNGKHEHHQGNVSLLR